jgi:hypothetical protein
MKASYCLLISTTLLFGCDVSSSQRQAYFDAASCQKLSWQQPTQKPQFYACNKNQGNCLSLANLTEKRNAL